MATINAQILARTRNLQTVDGRTGEQWLIRIANCLFIFGFCSHYGQPEQRWYQDALDFLHNHIAKNFHSDVEKATPAYKTAADARDFYIGNPELV